jgi:hypothetical protein
MNAQEPPTSVESVHPTPMEMVPMGCPSVSPDSRTQCELSDESPAHRNNLHVGRRDTDGRLVCWKANAYDLADWEAREQVGAR